ncbi:hypothetical protein ACRALDRAFT_206151 [Sodiomyces alcalophilus JCM 7366]|uniref:uncharacterized protein n=1 Tax=Sodiomyces alcalophilus JCM 7366 TaxID=591952 RepID=UPI0039B59DD9
MYSARQVLTRSLCSEIMIAWVRLQRKSNGKNIESSNDTLALTYSAFQPCIRMLSFDYPLSS